MSVVRCENISQRTTVRVVSKEKAKTRKTRLTVCKHRLLSDSWGSVVRCENPIVKLMHNTTQRRAQWHRLPLCHSAQQRCLCPRATHLPACIALTPRNRALRSTLLARVPTSRAFSMLASRTNNAVEAKCSRKTTAEQHTERLTARGLVTGNEGVRQGIAQ